LKKLIEEARKRKLGCGYRIPIFRDKAIQECQFVYSKLFPWVDPSSKPWAKGQGIGQ